MRVFWKLLCRKESTPERRNRKPAKFTPRFEMLEARELMSATIIPVTNATDSPISGKTDLRQAIAIANTSGNSAGYVIELTGGAVYSITQAGVDTSDNNATGAFAISSTVPVTIAGGALGNGSASYVNGNHLDRVFDIGPGAKVTLNNLVIENGQTLGDGGAMRTAPGSTVKLTNDVIRLNTAANGGGIAAGDAGFAAQGAATSGGQTTPVGSLTIVNSTTEDNHAAYSSSNDSGGCGGGIEDANAVVTISGGTITSNTADSCGGGVDFTGASYLTPGAVQANLSITNASVLNNQAGNASVQGAGGGISASGYGLAGNAVSLSGCTVRGNLASDGGWGGGIFFSDLSASITLCTISGNTAAASTTTGGAGGGICTMQAVLQLTSTNVTGNIAEAATSGQSYVVAGYAIGGSFNDNGLGGGICALDLGTPMTSPDGTSSGFSSLSISGGSINGNQAQGANNGGSGGGIYATPQSLPGIFTFNDATASGASASSSVVELTISNTTVSGNTALFGNSSASFGGGLYFDQNLSANLTSCTISGNVVGGGPSATIAPGSVNFASNGPIFGGMGGGIYLDGATCNLTGSTIAGNTAKPAPDAVGGYWQFGGQGAGIDAASRSILSVVNSTITRNVNSNYPASSAGAGIYADADTNVTVRNSTISYNDATGLDAAGGGIYDVGNSLTIVNSTIAYNTADLLVGSWDEGQAEGEGGGIFTACAQTFLINDTIAYNVGSVCGGVLAGNPLASMLEVTDNGIPNSATSTQGIFNNSTGVMMVTATAPSTQVQAPSTQVQAPSTQVQAPSSTAQVFVWNTIIAKNLTPVGPTGALVGRTETDVSGAFTSLGHNLIGTDQGSTGFVESLVHKVGTLNTPIADTNGDFVGSATPLSSSEVGLSTVLAANQAAGQSVPATLTLALTSGSLAHGNGDSSSALLTYLDQPFTINGVVELLPVDQRGYIRSSNLLPTGALTMNIGAF